MNFLNFQRKKKDVKIIKSVIFNSDKNFVVFTFYSDSFDAHLTIRVIDITFCSEIKK